MVRYGSTAARLESEGHGHRLDDEFDVELSSTPGWLAAATRSSPAPARISDEEQQEANVPADAAEPSWLCMRVPSVEHLDGAEAPASSLTRDESSWLNAAMDLASRNDDRDSKRKTVTWSGPIEEERHAPPPPVVMVVQCENCPAKLRFKLPTEATSGEGWLLSTTCPKCEANLHIKLKRRVPAPS